MKNKSVSTGSLNFRITASAAVGLIMCFCVLNVVIIAAKAYDEGAFGQGNSLVRFVSYYMDNCTSPMLLKVRGVEFILLILKLIFGSRSVRHKLKPVEDLSQMAERINNGFAFNEERLIELESAIDRISPSAGDTVLRTGDRELVGLEKAVNDLIQRMRESYAQQTRFVSDASHELRTPIAVIKGYADMLDRWGESDEKVLDESVAAIRAESANMTRLIEQLLFLARGDSGRTKLNITDCDISDILREVYDESRMIDSAHTYAFESPAPVPLKGDAALLKQTVRILVDNAAKYTPAGGSITIRATDAEKEAVFTVQDTGVGIKQEALPYIFDRFYRADDSRTRENGGTGLGLAIAKWIVDRHDGYFEVVSMEGLGTRMNVHIPKS
ncbi:MAG: sensor histidine kinase [Clostridia bacterium]|nr:sensor histidine kinase [Clostridia bacterium]